MLAQEKLKKKANEIVIQNIDVVDLILLDHQFLKECIETLTSEEEDKRKKLSVGRGFIEALAKHSIAEKKQSMLHWSPTRNFTSTSLRVRSSTGLLIRKSKCSR